MKITTIARKELAQVLAKAEAKGNVTKDGIYAMYELRKLGWIDKTTSVYNKIKCRNVMYECGFGGSKAKAHLRKPISSK